MAVAPAADSAGVLLHRPGQHAAAVHHAAGSSDLGGRRRPEPGRLRVGAEDPRSGHLVRRRPMTDSSVSVSTAIGGRLSGVGGGLGLARVVGPVSACATDDLQQAGRVALRRQPHQRSAAASTSLFRLFQPADSGSGRAESRRAARSGCPRSSGEIQAARVCLATGCRRSTSARAQLIAMLIFPAYLVVLPGVPGTRRRA